jgi:hypothetical protein
MKTRSTQQKRDLLERKPGLAPCRRTTSESVTAAKWRDGISAQRWHMFSPDDENTKIQFVDPL